MRFRYFFALVSIVGYLLYLTSQKTKEEKESKEKESDASDQEIEIAQEIINYTSGPCRGRCKVFDLKVFDSGTVELQSIKNVGKPGLHTFNISKEQVQELIALIDTESFSKMKDEYLIKSNKGSQQFEIIVDGKSTIFHKKKAPKALMKIKDALDRLIEVEK